MGKFFTGYYKQPEEVVESGTITTFNDMISLVDLKYSEKQKAKGYIGIF